MRCIRFAGTGAASRPFSFVRAKRKVSWTPKEKALMRMARYCRQRFPAHKIRIVFALSIRCRSCSVEFLHPVFDTAPAAAPRRAAVQAPAWLLGRRSLPASAAAALGAGQFNFLTPETEVCTEVCSGFFFWGIQSPFSSLAPQRRKWGFGNVPLSYGYRRA